MHKTHSIPIPVPIAAARRAPMSPLNAELVEFESWLETTLHLLGADGVLYARCVLSILRQTIDNGRLVGRRQSPDVLQNVTVVKSLGRDAVLSFPPGAMVGAVSPLDADADPASPTGQSGPRRRALLECLRTVELDERKLRDLTDEILERYAKVVAQCGAVSGNASQNDSIDSGVCPSPVESDQKSVLIHIHLRA
uniref:Uncharacterized protein n=1 Tax=Plectus sambesii TaxID=2011161 RepID=A0A914WE72_9BILA